MNTLSNMQDEVHEIQRLLGRNVILFQIIEKILKRIHHLKKGSNSFNNLKKRHDAINRLSLGRLTDNEVISKIDSKFKYDETKELVFSYDFLPDDESLNKSIIFLNSKNEDRNFMVHLLLDKWDFEVDSDRTEAKQWLLQLYEESYKESLILAEILKKIEDRTKEWSEYIYSDDFKNIFNKINT